MTLTCPGCAAPQPPSHLVGTLHGARPDRRVARFRCPRCGAGGEVLVLDGVLAIGQLGADGTFREHERRAVDDLGARWSGDGVAVRLDGHSWFVPAEEPVTH